MRFMKIILSSFAFIMLLTSCGDGSASEREIKKTIEDRLYDAVIEYEYFSELESIDETSFVEFVDDYIKYDNLKFYGYYNLVDINADILYFNANDDTIEGLRKYVSQNEIKNKHICFNRNNVVYIRNPIQGDRKIFNDICETLNE